MWAHFHENFTNRWDHFHGGFVGVGGFCRSGNQCCCGDCGEFGGGGGDDVDERQ